MLWASSISIPVSVCLVGQYSVLTNDKSNWSLHMWMWWHSSESHWSDRIRVSKRKSGSLLSCRQSFHDWTWIICIFLHRIVLDNKRRHVHFESFWMSSEAKRNIKSENSTVSYAHLELVPCYAYIRCSSSLLSVFGSFIPRYHGFGKRHGVPTLSMQLCIWIKNVLITNASARAFSIHLFMNQWKEYSGSFFFLF